MEENKLSSNSEHTKESEMETEKISKLFIKVVIPSMIAMVIIGIQGMVDGLFLGNFVSSNAMASVNIAHPFFLSTSAIGFVISIGATAFIGRLLGAKQEKDANDVFKTALISIIFSGIFFALVGSCFSEKIANMLGADKTLIADSTAYLRIIAIGLPAFMLNILCSFVNRTTGKTHLFAIGTIAGIFVNIILNYILIVKLEFGVEGAAIATSMSHFIGFLINLKPILLKNELINIYRGSFNKDYLKKVLYNGSSEGVTSISTALTTLIFNLTFMYYYGPSGVSAYTIISYISQVVILLIFGISDGASPIISYNYGAKRYDRVRAIEKISIIANLIIGVLAYLIIFFYGENLIALFAKGDTELIKSAYNGAKLYGVMFFMCGVNIFASAYFTSIGDALKSVIVSASRGIIFILAGIFILPNIFGVNGVWIVSPFADLITFIIVLIMLRKKSLKH